MIIITLPTIFTYVFTYVFSAFSRRYLFFFGDSVCILYDGYGNGPFVLLCEWVIVDGLLVWVLLEVRLLYECYAWLCVGDYLFDLGWRVLMVVDRCRGCWVIATNHILL